MRIATLCLAALLLTGCRVVFVPLPVETMGGVTLPAPTLAPTAEPAAPDNGAAFEAAYAEFAADFDAVKTQMDAARFADPDWRAETALRAQEWRRSILAIQAMPVPVGSAYESAWPQYQQAMDEFLFVAGAIDNAAQAGDQALLVGVDAHIAAAMTYLAEAQRIVRGE